MADMAGTPGWQWRADGNVFAGLNYQYRKYDDFKTLESQNWLMLAASRPVAKGDVHLMAMFSAEPFTLKKIGSPQVFQTGETFEGAPLIDYQHPHDLFSNLGANFTRSAGSYTWMLAGAVVGSPALGPESFMHRASAAENPQTPLSHHNLDSTHITPGVLTLGVMRNAVGIETSWFRGREPDEHRLDIDFGALDSWSVRGTWHSGPWNAQVSGGTLHEPEITEPGRDVTRLTASIGHTHTGEVTTASFAAWGQNREATGNRNAFLFESTVSWLDVNYLYSRAEFVAKDILGAGYDPIGFASAHPLSNVGAFTLGYTRDVTRGMRSRLGIGGDVTMYYVPPNLKDNYGGPLSVHLFLRYRFTSAPMIEGMSHHH